MPVSDGYAVDQPTAFLKVQAYSTRQFKDGPWCGYRTFSITTTTSSVSGEGLVPTPLVYQEYSRTAFERLKGTSLISVLLPNVTDPSLYLRSGRDIGEESYFEFQAANVVPNCSWWDSLGVGFVVRPAKNTTPANLADEFEVFRWPVVDPQHLDLNLKELRSWHDAEREKLDFILGDTRLVLQLCSIDLQDAAKRAVAEASRQLDRQVSRELATTDSTKASIGAIWDLSVVILGIMAMVSGRADGEDWIARRLHTVWKRVALTACPSRAPKNDGPSRYLLLVGKVLYCCGIVPLALIVAPATVLASDILARQDNPNGDTSELGWLSIEVGPQILVGVVSIRTTAVYNLGGLGLLWFNLALAVAGTLSIIGGSGLLAPAAAWCCRQCQLIVSVSARANGSMWASVCRWWARIW